jgi:hypothetical protein
VELVPCDETTLDAALDAWGLRGDFSVDVAARLWEWWNAWLDGPGKWPVAVAALDQMIA